MLVFEEGTREACPRTCGEDISRTTFSGLALSEEIPEVFLAPQYPHIRRPYKVPGGMLGAWIVTLLPFLYAAIASVFILVPADVSSFGVPRSTYELTEFTALGVIALLTAIFYLWGHLEKRNQNVVVELNFTDEGVTEVRLPVGDYPHTQESDQVHVTKIAQ